MLSRTLIACALPLALALQLTAAEAPDTGTEAKSADSKRQELLAKFDANHNGKIDGEEKAAVQKAADDKMKAEKPERFAKIDTNHDGSISPEERKAFRAEEKKRREEKLKAKNPELFAAMDSDKNGSISEEEAKAYRAAHPKKDKGGKDGDDEAEDKDEGHTEHATKK